VIGETPNLAARLQALAGNDEVVIPENTRRLVGNLFDYQSLDEVEVKGLAAPIVAFRVFPREPSWQSVRGAAYGRDAAGRARGGDRVTGAPVGTGKIRRRARGAGFRRGGDRQIAIGRGVSGEPRR
jgi:hypothetical protein